MSSSKTLVVLGVVAIALLSFAISYAGIFNYIALSAALQLLLQVVGVAIVILGVSFTALFRLNRAVDRADQA